MMSTIIIMPNGFVISVEINVEINVEPVICCTSSIVREAVTECDLPPPDASTVTV